eukprot:365417-Chlamydomonas_euryale.AAC.3
MRLSDTHSTRYRVLEAYAMMAGRNGAEVEAALGKLLDMANADPNSVPVLLAMASGICRRPSQPGAALHHPHRHH